MAQVATNPPGECNPPPPPSLGWDGISILAYGCHGEGFLATGNTPHLLHRRFLLSKTVRSQHWKLYRPSTGAVMLLTAMHTCDEVQPAPARSFPLAVRSSSAPNPPQGLWALWGAGARCTSAPGPCGVSVASGPLRIPALLPCKPRGCLCHGCSTSVGHVCRGPALLAWPGCLWGMQWERGQHQVRKGWACPSSPRGLPCNVGLAVLPPR